MALHDGKFISNFGPKDEKQPGNDTIFGTKQEEVPDNIPNNKIIITKSVYQKMPHRVAITMVPDQQEKVFYIGDGSIVSVHSIGLGYLKQ